MSMGRDENKIYTSEEREILARLRVGSLMICDGGSDPNSDGCGGQGYTGAAGEEPCRHCFGVGVMTRDLQRALQPAATGRPSVDEVAALIRAAMFSDRDIQWMPFGKRVAAMREVSEDIASKILALLAPDRGDGTRADGDCDGGGR